MQRRGLSSDVVKVEEILRHRLRGKFNHVPGGCGAAQRCISSKLSLIAWAALGAPPEKCSSNWVNGDLNNRILPAQERFSLSRHTNLKIAVNSQG